MPSEKVLSELVEETEELKAARAKFEKEDADYLAKGYSDGSIALQPVGSCH